MAHAEQDVFVGLLSESVRTKKADVVSTDQVGIRRVLDVRTIASNCPHPMELKAANAAKEQQYAGIPAYDPMRGDVPERSFLLCIAYVGRLEIRLPSYW